MLSSPDQNRPQQSNFLTIAQLIVSGLGLFGSLMAAVLLFILGLVVLINPKEAASSPASVFSLVWVSGLVAILTLPSFIFSLQRLRSFRLPLPRINGFRLATLMILIWPLVLVLGNWASKQDSFSWLILPPLLLLAIGLPVWWLIEFSRRKLPGGSLQRGWGVVNFSLLLTNPLVIIVELVLLFFLLIGLVVWLLNQPALLQELETLAREIQGFRNDPSALLPLLSPYLQKPGVILALLALLAVIIPAIEEALKPLALWLLVRHRLSPAEGFVAGALCGGSFALLESLLSLAGQAQQGWALIAVGRAGTGLLHITTTALIGWAMTRAWQKGSYLHLGLIYLVAVAIHGTWNALSLLMGMRDLIEAVPINSALLSVLVRAAPAALVFLALILFALLWVMNRRLRQPPAPVEPAVIDSPQSI